jgi:uncharacterized protein YjbI with pentapeptide repeats
VANKEHLKRLNQGVAKWNAWREEASVLVDLIGAKLSRANLTDANLTDANLFDADLSDADLSRATLFAANLFDANLRDANLRDANLRDANLRDANLRDANLRDANLGRANLDGANLAGANLTRAVLFDANLTRALLLRANLTHTHLFGANLGHAILHETIFGDVDLSGVFGLETCDHHRPSIIDNRTLQRSGPLPLSFLRGAGLPDNFIDYIPSLFDQAIQFYSCFISYSAKDDEFAHRIHADLQNKGVRCWFAPHDMKIGEEILDGVDTAIRVRDKVLLVLSQHSIASNWVKKEVNTAFDEEERRKCTVLFPVRIDDTVMETNEAWAAQLRRRHIGDFRHWKDHDDYKKSLDRVLRDLKLSTERATDHATPQSKA